MRSPEIACPCPVPQSNSSCCVQSKADILPSLQKDSPVRWSWSVLENAGQLFTAVYVAPLPSAPWPAELVEVDLVEAELAPGFAHKETFCGAEICLVIDTSCSSFLWGPSHSLILLCVALNPEENNWKKLGCGICYSVLLGYVVLLFGLSVSNLPGFFHMLRTTSSMPYVTLQCLWWKSWLDCLYSLMLSLLLYAPPNPELDIPHFFCFPAAAVLPVG